MHGLRAGLGDDGPERRSTPARLDDDASHLRREVLQGADERIRMAGERHLELEPAEGLGVDVNLIFEGLELLGVALDHCEPLRQLGGGRPALHGEVFGALGVHLSRLNQADGPLHLQERGLRLEVGPEVDLSMGTAALAPRRDASMRDFCSVGRSSE